MSDIRKADYDVIIIGSGPAGLTAAIYAARATLSALVVEKDFMGTGQISITERVDNYPGLYGISGYDLGEKFREQAETLGTEFFEGEAESFIKTDGLWEITFKDGAVKTAKAVIYSAGTSYRHLGVKGDGKQRISYCAVCDGFFYKDKVVAVIGGGDTALGDALYLSKLAKTVYLIHRRDQFRASKALQKKVAETENIVPVMSAVLSEVTGGDNAEGLVYTQDGESKSVAVDGVFCAVGSIPNTDTVKGVCDVDGGGYIIAGEDGVTSAEGFFAAGDVRTTPLRQVITACADGANALSSAERYISEKF